MKRITRIIALFVLFFHGFHYAHETDPLTRAERQRSITYNLQFESNCPDSFVIYRGFVVSYCYSNRIPYYTIHRITPQQLCDPPSGALKRRSSFFCDDNYLKNRSALNSDYKSSGYDKGHMVPAGDFCDNSLLKNETFVLSNICPQTPWLNRGLWQNIESKVREFVRKSNTGAVIITGTVSDSKCNTIGNNSVGVPEYIYKIVYFYESKKMFAFMCDNTIGSFNEGKLSNYQVTVNFIERIVHEDFFDRLPDELEESLESRIIPIE